jgi:uncharacterized protein
VAGVQNIPWGERHTCERHTYVLARGNCRGSVLSDELEKSFHVSPLMGMDQTYAFRASQPGDRLAVQIESRPREIYARSLRLKRKGARYFPHPGAAG